MLMMPGLRFWQSQPLVLEEAGTSPGRKAAADADDAGFGPGGLALIYTRVCRKTLDRNLGVWGFSS